METFYVIGLPRDEIFIGQITYFTYKWTEFAFRDIYSVLYPSGEKTNIKEEILVVYATITLDNEKLPERFGKYDMYLFVNEAVKKLSEKNELNLRIVGQVDKSDLPSDAKLLLRLTYFVPEGS